jgi:hypothetical protein
MFECLAADLISYLGYSRRKGNMKHVILIPGFMCGGWGW